MKEEEREAWEAIKEGISTLEDNGNWIKEGRRIAKKKENREETGMTTDLMSEARGGDVLKADLRSEKSMMEEEAAMTTDRMSEARGGYVPEAE